MRKENQKNIPVVILCGGMGTRLREETEYKPKPMVDIGGKPIVWHIMKIYAHYGYTKFILCLGYKGSVIKDYFLNYEAMSNDLTVSYGGESKTHYLSNHKEQNFEITLVDTGLHTMTGGRVKRIEKFIENETFMVTYGDGLANIDIDKLVAFHRSHGKLATLTAARPPSRFGILELTQKTKLNNFVRKLQLNGSTGAFWSSTVVFLITWI